MEDTGIREQVIQEICALARKYDVDEETSTLLKFDIVDLGRNIQEELLESIRREGRILYEKE